MLSVVVEFLEPLGALRCSLQLPLSFSADCQNFLSLKPSANITKKRRCLLVYFHYLMFLLRDVALKNSSANLTLYARFYFVMFKVYFYANWLLYCVSCFKIKTTFRLLFLGQNLNVDDLNLNRSIQMSSQLLNGSSWRISISMGNETFSFVTVTVGPLVTFE